MINSLMYSRGVRFAWHNCEVCALSQTSDVHQCFEQTYRAQYGSTIWVYLHGTLIWWLEKYTVNIWNLLWSSRPLIICTGQTNIYINIFPATLNSQMAKNHKINVYFFDKHDHNCMSMHRNNSKI